MRNSFKLLFSLVFISFQLSLCHAQEPTDNLFEFPGTGAWNGFLGQLNVVECTNRNSSILPLTLTLTEGDGTSVGEITEFLPPESTRHIVLNSLEIADKIGVIRIDVDESLRSLADKLACQTVIYRQADDGSVLYAYALPINKALSAKTFLFINTSPIGTLESATQNWLTVINADSETAQTFTLTYYDQSGTEVSTAVVEDLGALQRRDIPVALEDSALGMLSIESSESGGKYQAFITRRSADFATFAFSVPGKSGSCSTLPVSVSTMDPADNWLEIANTSSSSKQVELVIRDNTGEIVHQADLSLAANAQTHFYVNAVLGDSNLGSAQLICDNPLSDSFIVQSLHYGIISRIFPQLNWAYASEREDIFLDPTTNIVFPVNTFLGSYNWLKLRTIGASSFSGTVQTNPVFSLPQEGVNAQQSSVELGDSQGKDIFQNDAFSSNNIGSTIISPELVGSRVSAELLRVFPSSDGSTIDTILRIPPQVISTSQLELTPFITGLVQPVYITHAGDSSGRLFIVTKLGFIFIYKDGAIVPDPFLDISALLPADTLTTEQGLQSVAFHPNFENNGRFFIVHNRADGNETLAEYTISGNPDIADAASRTELLSVSKTATFHNGGQVGFGPDNYLYMSFGDGGPQEDPEGNSQNPNNLLGSIIRIDVDNGGPYTIPADNPFVGVDGFRDEIWAYGFRNPWRFSFDTQGRMFVGDVGQVMVEEIDIVEKGKNYGWNTMEGTQCFNPSTACSTEGLEMPIHDYGRVDGGSVIGGYVYRGTAISSLVGAYIFGDFNSKKIWALRENSGGTWSRSLLFESSALVTSFGEGPNGEIYMVDILGTIYRIDAAS